MHQVHVFSDTGIYTIKLVVNAGTPCADSTTSRIKVYPGYFPAFSNNSPMCKNTPVQFRDQTTANYGFANKWRWDFGVSGILSDTSIVKNPVFTLLHNPAPIRLHSLLEVTKDVSIPLQAILKS